MWAPTYTRRLHAGTAQSTSRRHTGVRAGRLDGKPQVSLERTRPMFKGMLHDVNIADCVSIYEELISLCPNSYKKVVTCIFSWAQV